MGFIREPEGVDFVIAPTNSFKENIAYISSCIRQHKTNDKADNSNRERRNIKQESTL